MRDCEDLPGLKEILLVAPSPCLRTAARLLYDHIAFLGVEAINRVSRIEYSSTSYLISIRFTIWYGVQYIHTVGAS
jgi:hypothetical protein